MKKMFELSTFMSILKVVFLWRILLFLVALIAVTLVNKTVYPFPYTDSILIPTGLPKWIWGFANFDGVHYIRTALWGYVSEYSQAFFPLYPLLMSGISTLNIFGIEPKVWLLVTGLMISFLSFVGAIYFYRKILLTDFKDRVVELSLLTLLVFPTSFFFFAVYTESLFLFLSSVAIYLILKKKYLFAAVFIALATATRIMGIFLLIVYLLEIFKDWRKDGFKETKWELFLMLFGFLIAGSGLVLYMFYLYYNYNNSLYFLTAQPVFGASRQVDQVILLPQVLFRYAKILFTVPLYSSQFFTALLELLFSLFGLFLLWISYKKIRLSFWLFSLAVYLLPTLTGTLSSMPRYILLLYLLFPALVICFNDRSKIMLTIFFVLQIVFTSLFVLGFWIA